VTKLDLTLGEIEVRLRRDDRNAHQPVVNPVVGGTVAPPADAPALVGLPAPSAVSPPTPADDEAVVTSPMVGTFYASASPGTPPFVQVGDRVEIGQTVGIVEAMKIMNEIVAERAGFVAAILVENGQAVQYGSPLIRLAAAPGSADAGGRAPDLSGLA
jgi:acetyl-CoA carboxylase biotin carboxyl carrier protein